MHLMCRYLIVSGKEGLYPAVTFGGPVRITPGIDALHRRHSVLLLRVAENDCECKITAEYDCPETLRRKGYVSSFWNSPSIKLPPEFEDISIFWGRWLGTGEQVIRAGFLVVVKAVDRVENRKRYENEEFWVRLR